MRGLCEACEPRLPLQMSARNPKESEKCPESPRQCLEETAPKCKKSQKDSESQLWQRAWVVEVHTP